METVTFIGLGGMGGNMAGRLADYFALSLYDLDAAKAAAVKGADVTVAPTMAGAIRKGGIVVTMLPDDKTLYAVTKGEQGIAALLGEGGLHINTSTISPQAARELAACYEATGGSYVAAPVWGRPDTAGKGGLVCSLAGPAEAKQRARTVIDKLAGTVQDFGEEPQLANVAKVIGNFLVVSAIEALGEGLALAEKQGLDRIALANLLTSTLFDCPVYKIYGKLVGAQASGPAGFSAELGLKDLRLVREIAADVGTPLPLQNIIENRLITTIEKGRGKEDWSSLTWLAAEEAGLKRPVGQ